LLGGIADHGSDIGLHDLKHVWKGIVEHMMGVLGRELDRSWFNLFQGWGGGSEILLEHVKT